jgi:hypothetical protein
MWNLYHSSGSAPIQSVAPFLLRSVGDVDGGEEPHDSNSFASHYQFVEGVEKVGSGLAIKTGIRLWSGRDGFHNAPPDHAQGSYQLRVYGRIMRNGIAPIWFNVQAPSALFDGQDGPLGTHTMRIYNDTTKTLIPQFSDIEITDQGASLYLTRDISQDVVRVGDFFGAELIIECSHSSGDSVQQETNAGSNIVIRFNA